MTGGALSWVARSYPGPYYSPRGVDYTCVTSQTVVGKSGAGSGTAQGGDEGGGRTLGQYASTSYGALCGGAGGGDGVVGDAVVPCAWALLEGTREVVLEGVYHSMSRVGTFDEPSGLPWYGSEEVVDAWAGHLVKPRFGTESPGAL